MKKGKEIMLTDSMEGFQEKAINYNDYEVSFRRWLVIQIDSGNLSHQEASERFSLPAWEYKKIIRRWQERYSDETSMAKFCQTSGPLCSEFHRIPLIINNYYEMKSTYLCEL